jgi:formylglycine-generating enzyme required for sulfatase activity
VKPAIVALLAVLALAWPAHARSGGTRQAHTNDEVVVLRAVPEGRVLIKGGTFKMGSEIGEIALAQKMCREDLPSGQCEATTFADEMVAHEVLLDAFWIDRTEVTNKAYRRCVEVGVCTAPRHAGAVRWSARDDHPVTLVTWADADRFCRWRGARLPTEAEWERAARGLRGRIFPWGNVYNPNLLNHGRVALIEVDRLDDGDGFAELAPVASFVAGATSEGVHDLAGNVEEWVADWYAEGYADPDTHNPRGPTIGNYRVVRGGSFRHGRAWLRAAARDKAIPSLSEPWRGFRCAADAR